MSDEEPDLGLRGKGSARAPCWLAVWKGCLEEEVLDPALEGH